MNAKRKVEHETIQIERVFHAPAALVFSAWAHAEAKRQWFGCHEDWEPLEYTSDFRVGGREINRARPPGEVEHLYDARYEDIVPNERIVIAYTMTLGSERISSSLMTVEFHPEKNTTRMFFTEQLAVLDARYPAAGREEGWNEILNGLQKYMEENSRCDARERLIEAPCEQVYRMFSDPQHLARWWGPKGFSNTFREFDLRKGGYWRFTMHSPDGKDYPNESCFVEVIPHRRVVLEHGMGHHFFLTITFIEKGQHTVVGWRQVFDTVEHYQQIADFVANANEENLDRLTAEVKPSLN